MASIAGFGQSARWSLAALLRRLLIRPVEVEIELDTATREPLVKKRFYPPQRDAFLERSAMAREMFRL